MKGFLLDTHIWFWYLVGSERLPRGLRRDIDAAQSGCWLSPISVWELGMLTRRGRIRLNSPFRDWVSAAHERFPVREAPLNLEVAVTSLEIRLPHRDPADHFLAATALVFELTLMTIDRHLTQVKGLSTRSV
ncbi:MAG: type II toxin-antitoxin system VapC family toxin [Deinococcus sp.]|nr:type II toxin-antitoxin system VapC family toxin [Deinococcus sp.]